MKVRTTAATEYSDPYYDLIDNSGVLQKYTEINIYFRHDLV
jgi:hypothetical protein